jgi:hypothetical protein
MAAYDRDLNCEVYLVGHHGSAGSSSAPWLAKMAPKFAIASFGPNDFGHPTAVALCRAQAAGAQVYATQRAGTISATSDGSVVSLVPQTPETADYCAAGANFWLAYSPPAPTPAHTPTPTPTPTAELNMSASASPADPCQYTTVTLSAHVSRAGAGISGVLVEAVLHFKTTDSEKNGTTVSSGDASIDYYISGASAGYKVTVDLTASEGGHTAHAQTHFTPKTC